MNLLEKKKAIISGFIIYIVFLFVLFQTFNLPYAFSFQLGYFIAILTGLIPGLVTVYLGKLSEYTDGAISGLFSVFLGNLILTIIQVVISVIPGAYPANFETFIQFNSAFSPVVVFEIFAVFGGILGVFLRQKMGSKK